MIDSADARTAAAFNSIAEGVRSFERLYARPLTLEPVDCEPTLRTSVARNKYLNRPSVTDEYMRRLYSSVDFQFPSVMDCSRMLGESS